MAGGDPRFGTIATYMRSLNHSVSEWSSPFVKYYDYKIQPIFSVFRRLDRNVGKVRARGEGVRSCHLLDVTPSPLAGEGWEGGCRRRGRRRSANAPPAG